MASCLGARAAGPRLLLVAWVVVASSRASVAKRIAGSYRKKRADVTRTTAVCSTAQLLGLACKTLAKTKGLGSRKAHTRASATQLTQNDL